MAPKVRTVEQVLARIAGNAHGVVTRVELLRAGVSAAEIKHRVRAGALLRQYRGVYRVGHQAPSVEARYLAAVKACGAEARLSGRAAGYLFDALTGPPPPPEVTSATQRQVAGVRNRRSRDVDQRETTTHRGIPTTTIARTLVDSPPS